MQNIYLPEGQYSPDKTPDAYCSDEKSLYKAMAEKRIICGRAVLCDKNMNLTVDIGCGIVGYMPRNEAVFQPDGSSIKDIAVLTRVGKSVCFHINSIVTENGRRVAYISRASAQMECYRNYISKLTQGDIIPCKITHTEQFGAFADIGCGLVALLPVDCISVSRIERPDERFSVGDELRCVVRSIDETTGRVFISTKELFGTWEENSRAFLPGQTVSGIIRSVEPYGVFIELSPNLAGLAEYSPDVRAGDTAAVYIKSINAEKMKIKLVIVSSSSAPIEKKAPEYYVLPDVKHMDVWKYSPDVCSKTVQTVFN